MVSFKSPCSSGPLPVLILLALLIGAVQPASAQCADLPGCVLVWSDEFDGTEVDLSKWTFQLGDGTEVGLPPGWGNNELQYYQAENATVAGSFLTITAKEESVGGRDYTSARMRSLGKGDWTFGRMEMRAKMPIGQGLWPAFWMLPSDSIYGTWAASGEIDIVEYIGSQPDRIIGTIHYGGPWPGNVYSSTDYFLPSGTFHDDFHVFALEWELGEIRWYVDGLLYATRNYWYSTGGAFPAPFDVDFHLLLNLAVGGNLPGPPDATTVFPQEYVIDYVRVYQLPPSSHACAFKV
jgi:beta-glucanase (GH16 family)